MDFPDLPTGAILQFWYAAPRAWEEVTDDYEFEDGGKDFNEVSDDPPRRWRYEVAIPKGTHTAAKAIADVYETFFESVRYSQPFSFTDKYGTTWSNVRIEPNGYQRSHDAHKSWVIFIKFNLVGYNSVGLGVPTSLAVTGEFATSIGLSWSAGIGATSYEVRRDGGTPVNVGNVLTYTAGGLANGTDYDFEVRSYDGTRYSGWSSVVTGTTTVPALSAIIDSSGNAIIDSSGNSITMFI